MFKIGLNEVSLNSKDCIGEPCENVSPPVYEMNAELYWLVFLLLFFHFINMEYDFYPQDCLDNK